MRHACRCCAPDSLLDCQSERPVAGVSCLAESALNLLYPNEIAQGNQGDKRAPCCLTELSSLGIGLARRCRIPARFILRPQGIGNDTAQARVLHGQPRKRLMRELDGSRPTPTHAGDGCTDGGHLPQDPLDVFGRYATKLDSIWCNRQVPFHGKQAQLNRVQVHACQEGPGMNQAQSGSLVHQSVGQSVEPAPQSRRLSSG